MPERATSLSWRVEDTGTSADYVHGLRLVWDTGAAHDSPETRAYSICRRQGSWFLVQLMGTNPRQITRIRDAVFVASVNGHDVCIHECVISAPMMRHTLLAANSTNGRASERIRFKSSVPFVFAGTLSRNLYGIGVPSVGAAQAMRIGRSGPSSDEQDCALRSTSRFVWNGGPRTKSIT